MLHHGEVFLLVQRPCFTQPVTLIRVQKDEEVEFFRQKFAGSQSDRAEKAAADAKIALQLIPESNVYGVFRRARQHLEFQEQGSGKSAGRFAHRCRAACLL